MSTSELATSYAALILADDGVDITANKLQDLIKAAKIEEIESTWTSPFAKPTKGKTIKNVVPDVNKKNRTKLNAKASKNKHLAAYLLLGRGENSEPSAQDCKNILEIVGIQAYEERLEDVIGEFSGRGVRMTMTWRVWRW